MKGFAKFMGWAIFIITGLWAFFIELKIIVGALGSFWAVVAFFLAPVTFAIVPWYMLFAKGSIFLLLLGYGGSTIAYLLIKVVGKQEDL